MSIDGCGRALDNMFVARPGRTGKDRTQVFHVLIILISRGHLYSPHRSGFGGAFLLASRSFRSNTTGKKPRMTGAMSAETKRAVQGSTARHEGRSEMTCVMDVSGRASARMILG